MDLQRKQICIGKMGHELELPASGVVSTALFQGICTTTSHATVDTPDSVMESVVFKDPELEHCCKPVRETTTLERRLNRKEKRMVLNLMGESRGRYRRTRSTLSLPDFPVTTPRSPHSTSSLFDGAM